MKLKIMLAMAVTSLGLAVALEVTGQTAQPPSTFWDQWGHAIGALLPEGKAVKPWSPLPKWARGPLFWVSPDRDAPAGTQYKTFHSATINADVSYVVYLPPDYERDTHTRYPVLYYLHGSSGTPATAAKQVVPRLDEAIRAGRVAPMIAIFVNGLLGATMYCNSRDGKWPLETVIIKDLIPYVDATYRTLPSRESRAIEGFSMGGFGAAHLGFKYPEMFGVISIGGPAFVGPGIYGGLSQAWQLLFPSPTGMGGDEAYWKTNDPFVLLKKNAVALRDRTFIRIVTHDFESQHNSQAMRCEELHELMVQLMIPHEFCFLMNVKVHSPVQVQETLGDAAFSFFSSALPRWQTYRPTAIPQQQSVSKMGAAKK